MAATYFAPTTRILWKIVESYGVDPEPLFRKLHVDPRLMEDGSARIQYSVADLLWVGASKLVDDPCFGLRAAKYWHPSNLNALGYAWLASTSLRTALGRFCRYSRILSSGAVIELKEEPGSLYLEITYTERTASFFWRVDALLALLISMCRVNYGEKLDPVYVSISHPEPSCAGDYFALFRCPVEFSAAENRIAFSQQVADERLPGANPQFAQLNDEIVINYLARLEGENIVHRVKAAIIENLPSGGVSDASIADVLYMNVRSLQRRLKADGTTFKTLLNETRKELAESYIQDDKLTLSEISFMLGFSEISSFSRAFKRWTGASPKAYRQAG